MYWKKIVLKLSSYLKFISKRICGVQKRWINTKLKSLNNHKVLRFKRLKVFYYSGENVVCGLDPLQPKPKRSKKSKDGNPSFKFEQTATTARDLKIHVESKHKSKRYPCSKCEYAATRADNLKRHVESKHKVCYVIMLYLKQVT